MQLTEKQRSISEDPLYWEWFKKWWDQDFSIENLKNHQTPDGQDLSEIYICDKNYITKFSGRNWHPINTPSHDLEGNLNHSKKGNAYFLVKQKQLHLPYLIGMCRTDWLPSDTKEYISCYIPPSTDPRYNPRKTTKCLWGKKTASVFTLQGDHRELYLLNHPHSYSSVTLYECTVGENISVLGKHTHELGLYDCNLPDGITLKGKVIRLERANSRNIYIALDNSAEIYFDCHEAIDQYLEVFTPIPKSGISIAENNRSVELNLYETERLHLRLIRAEVNKLEARSYSFRKFEAFHCTFNDFVSLEHKEFEHVNIYNSSFRYGLDFSNTTILKAFNFRGVKAAEKSIFRETIFLNQVQFSDYLLNDDTIRPTTLQNANFSKSQFQPIKDTDILEIIFNDVEFVGGSQFDGAIFNGIPKFHGATIHSETSFDGAKWKGSLIKYDDHDDNIVQNYQSAFRCLRQHMEIISNYAQAAEFGVLEMKAKQNRKDRTVVPKSVSQVTKLYGIIANYGQSFMRPIYWLGGIGVAFISLQFLLFALFSSDCTLFDEGCEIDARKAQEASWRGVTFLIPPFTLLIKRSIEQETGLKYNYLLQILSGTAMLAHALLASFLVFLIGLALKRRLQMR